MTTYTRSIAKPAPGYKDYVNFLEGYKNGKRDDQTENSDSGVSVKSFSLSSSSSNASSSSLNSDVTDFSKPSAVSYNNYLESSKNKKFNTVKPKTTMKSEIFIEIQPTKPVSEISEMFANRQDRRSPPKNNINSKRHIFEKQISTENKPKIADKPVLGNRSPPPKIEVEVIINAPPTPPVQVINTSQINNVPPPPPMMNNAPAKTIGLQIKSGVNDNHKNVPLPPPIVNTAPNKMQATLIAAPQIKCSVNNNNANVPPPPPMMVEGFQAQSGVNNANANVPPPPPMMFGSSQAQSGVNNANANVPLPPPMINIEPPKMQATLVGGPQTKSNVNNNNNSNGMQQPPLPPPLMNTAQPKIQATLNGRPQTRFTTGNPNGVNPDGTIDRNNPLVKKLVYGTLRGLYGSYHDKANDIVATLPRNMVKKNNEIQNIIDKMAQQSRLPGAGPGLEPSSGGIRAPPPPPIGHIPSVRLKSEIPDRRMEPPPCVQNAMMKQDKKPFTYTPGGIDLSEIKSPRMARRIERNANYSGAPETTLRPSQQQPVGPLPPSALAAMNPQIQVQVFPTGPAPPPPGPRAGAPPPPPPPLYNIPPPPPPPLQPLPTQKLVTSENQVIERPDMTRIIPDNPMALLRKTGGPEPRKSFVDEMYNTQSMKTPLIQQPLQNQRRIQSPQVQIQPQAPPPLVQMQQQAPAPFVQPESQRWAPPIQPVQPEPPRYQPKIVERNQNNDDQVLKTSTAHLGSLYIPPINQQPQQQRSVASPPTPPKRDPQSPQIQSPSTPTLKEAPRPWQKQQKPAEQLPPWTKKEPASPPTPQEQVQQPPPQRFPVQQQTNQRPVSPKTQQSAPNAVYITQPVVLQHPGPQPRVDAQGAILVPVQIEGVRKVPATPVTPGNDRSLNRQQSWSNNPTQSNSFKVIQKMTQTDGDDDIDNAPVIEHGPRYPQRFQQTPPVDQVRKLKLSEGDRELMNRFRQEEEDPRYRGGLIPSRVFRILDESGVDDDTSLHNEVDPRYRGAAIPSKAFKLLQSMTDGSSDTPSTPGVTVSRGPPGGNRTPQVRNIPIQIERDDQPRNYVHPSEQTVPEPKKYTGSSIPGRAFKMLQAQTATDSCANANEVNELYDPSSYNQWGYDPNYPPPVPPYWPDYYYNYYYPPNSKEQNETNDRDIRQTPVPFWGYYPPPSPYPYVQPPIKTPDIESDAETPRNTPLPYWGYYPTYYPSTPSREMEDWGAYPQENKDDPNQQNFTPSPYPYPPYWDPYYYYYGYPPMYSPYPYYDSEEVAGYSSTDEMAYFSRKIKDEREKPEEDRSITPRILITPTLPEEFAQKNIEPGAETESERDTSESDSETEVETEEEQTQLNRSNSNGLQAIRSVKDIKIYDDDEEQNCSDDEPIVEEEGSEETDDSPSYIAEEDTIPHQLSVIFEESERSRSDSRRESSVLSDSTTIAEDDEENSTTVSVKLPLQFKFEVTGNEEITTVTVGESEIKIEDEIKEDETDDEAGPDTFASFVVTTPKADHLEDKIENETVICASDEEKKPIPNGDLQMSEEDEDWWGILNKDDDVMPSRPKKIIEEAVAQPEPIVDDKKEANGNDDDASSTSSSDSSSSESTASKKEVKEQDSSSESDDSDSDDDSSDSEEIIAKTDKVENPEPLSIKERIQALKDSINGKRDQLKDENENKMSVKAKVSAIEAGNLQNNSKTTSTKSSVKSFEEFSEEEGDSGVTSDMSRHISDNEEFPELKKMTRYQRAATHSRLFKLLQEVCEEEDEKEKEEEKKQAENLEKNKEESTMRRDQLSLPLNNVSDESFSSSGITSPGSPVNEKLVTELVQSILKRKKGHAFRNIPKEKLQAAAKRILQEEFDDMSTPDSSFLSPLRNSTESSTPAQTPQEFYNDYKQYYDSWSDADGLGENYDILPSKAFKLLQEHSGLNRTGAIAGLLAKCPKVLSSNSVHQEMMKLMEPPESDPSTDKSLEPSEVTSAS